MFFENHLPYSTLTAQTALLQLLIDVNHNVSHTNLHFIGFQTPYGWFKGETASQHNWFA